MSERALPAAVGRYRVVRLLGAGGMGVVYEALDPATGRRVAIKVIQTRGASEAAIARFTREAEVLARIRHPGVVAIHELGSTPAGPFLVEELIPGETLFAVLARGPLDPRRAAQIVHDLADALAAVHAAGALHRDLKPGNVILSPDGKPVLLDFGLARDTNAERLTVTGEIMGTLRYMAPEQVSGESSRGLDGRVDVYALGVLLYELLTGSAPYDGAPMELMAAIVVGEPRPPRALRPEIPPDLEAICLRAMARARDDRYPQARALRDALAAFLRGETRGKSRRRAVAALAVPGSLALGALAWVAARTHAVTPAPLPSLAPSPAASPATEREAALLWELEPAASLVYELWYEERTPDAVLTIRATLGMKVSSSAGRASSLACVVTRLRCETGPARSSERIAYDSAQPDPAHPLAMLQAAVDRPFRCVLDARTGEVASLDGFEAIRAAVHSVPSHGLDQLSGQGSSDRLIETVFQDDFVRQSMNALTCMLGNVALGWRASRSPGVFQLATREPQRAILPSVIGGPPLERALYTGSARFTRGRLEEAQIHQTGAATADADMRWGMTLVR